MTATMTMSWKLFSRTIWSRLFTRHCQQKRNIPFHRIILANTVRSFRPHSARTMTFTTPPFLALLGFGKSKQENTASEESLLDKADRLFDGNFLDDLYELLIAQRELDDPEILWRLGRAAYSKAQEMGGGEKSDQLMRDALAYVSRALSLDENNSAIHKWYAIMLDVVGELDGTKQRISNSFLVKEHFVKSIKLNPKDATAIYSLGLWCFLFADMPWYQRKLASVIFATPPSSSYEEALTYFEEAEKVDPNFYSKNLLMLGKTNMRLGNKEKAAEFLKRAKDYPIKTEDDRTAHQEAVDLLKQLGL